MFVAISNVSPAFFGAEMKRRNSRDLLQRYFRLRHEISFKPLVDQLATVVNTAAREGDRFVRQKSVSISHRFAHIFKPYVDTRSLFGSVFFLLVNTVNQRPRYSIVVFFL